MGDVTRFPVCPAMEAGSPAGCYLDLKSLWEGQGSLCLTPLPGEGKGSGLSKGRAGDHLLECSEGRAGGGDERCYRKSRRGTPVSASGPHGPASLLAYMGHILESHGLGSSQGSLLICPFVKK